MTTNELYNLVLEQSKIQKIDPLHKAMLEECCEKALNNEQGITDKSTLMFSASVAFLAANSTVQGVLKTALESGNKVTLDYREQQFIITKDSFILR